MWYSTVSVPVTETWLRAGTRLPRCLAPARPPFYRGGDLNQRGPLTSAGSPSAGAVGLWPLGGWCAGALLLGLSHHLGH